MLRLVSVLILSSLVAWGQNSPLLVLLKGVSALGFYTPNGSLLAQAPVGQHPHEMVLSRDGRYVYTTDNGTMRIEQAGTGGNTISIVEVAGRKKVGEISLGDFRRPHGLALDTKTGRLAVTCELPDQLVIVDPAKREVLRTYRTKGKTSHMVTLGPDGRWAYVSNSSSSNVAAINLTSGWVSLIPTGERPEGSVLSKDGKHVYVTNRETAAITVIDTSKQEAVGRIPTGKGPVRIASTPDGRLLVYAAMHDKAIEFADPAAGKVVARVPVSGTPVSLHLSPDGKLAFASAEESDTVYVISVDERKVVREFKTAAGAAPDPVLALR